VRTKTGKAPAQTGSWKSQNALPADAWVTIEGNSAALEQTKLKVPLQNELQDALNPLIGSPFLRVE
jgi:hypothetical protein